MAIWYHNGTTETVISCSNGVMEMTQGEAKFKVGDHVCARHSGKVYIVTAVWALDECGSFACAVRGWRGGRYYGATRRMAESALMFESEMGRGQ